MFRAFAFVALLAVSTSACERFFRSCTSDSAIGYDISFECTPAWDNLKAGDAYELTTRYSMTKEVTGGTDAQIAKLSGITIENKKVDLCDELKDTPGAECPLPEGPREYVISGTVDPSLPSGTLYASSTWTTPDGEEILCYESQLCL